MSLEMPIKLSLYGCNDGENIVIIGVGEIENKILSNFTNISQIRKHRGIIKSIVLCSNNDVLGKTDG